MEVTTKRKKKSACPPKCHGSRCSPFSMASTLAATSPPPRLAMKLEMNQIPIRNETRRTGETLVTYDSPVGERQSSPTVCQKYVAKISHIEALTPGASADRP